MTDHAMRRGHPGFNRLSDREREILRLYPSEAVHKGMAHRLGISEQTIKNHVSTILRKLGAQNFGQAAVWFDRYEGTGWAEVITDEILREDLRDAVLTIDKMLAHPTCSEELRGIAASYAMDTNEEL